MIWIEINSKQYIHSEHQVTLQNIYYSLISLIQTPTDSYAYYSPTSLVKSLHKQPKNKKDKSLDNRTAKTTLRTHSQKVSPLASSNFQSIPFDSPLLLQILGTLASSLLSHFVGHPFSHFAAEPCCKKSNNYKHHNTTINQKSNIHMVVTSSHTSAHAKLQYESKYHNTTINKKFLLISNHCNECKKNSSTN